MARKYRYFSADSHFESLPETWTHRVPEKFRDRAPRRIKLADGRDAIVEEGQPLEYRGTNLFAGKLLEEFNPVHLNFEGSVGVLRTFASVEEDVPFPDFPWGAAVGTIVDAEGAAAFREMIETEIGRAHV